MGADAESDDEDEPVAELAELEPEEGDELPDEDLLFEPWCLPCFDDVLELLLAELCLPCLLCLPVDDALFELEWWCFLLDEPWWPLCDDDDVLSSFR